MRTASPVASAATASRRTSPSIKSEVKSGWDCGLDQAVNDVNFAEVKRLGLLIKTIMDVDQWLA